MNNDPGIVCFRHCSTKSVFCMSVPVTCPICSSHLRCFLVDPFRVPYPLVNAVHNPTSVVVRPARGNFLEDYNATCDLHVGVVDSVGCVVEFDRDGLIINDLTRWTDCIAFKTVTIAWTARWDETLLLMLKDIKWRSANYNETSLNCFDFVLEFFNNLEHAELKFTSKEDFCEKLILSKIQNVIRYSLLYKALKDRTYMLSDNV